MEYAGEGNLAGAQEIRKWYAKVCVKGDIQMGVTQMNLMRGSGVLLGLL